MTATDPPPEPLPGTWRRRVKRHAVPIGLLVLLAYMLVVPLVELQSLALQDGASGYRDALGTRQLAETLATTVKLGLGAMAISLLLGTSLAWFSLRLPRRWRWLGVLPLLPIVIPPVASVVGWALLLSPRAGLINKAWRGIGARLPWGAPDVTTGPADVYTATWITILVGMTLTSFVYVFVRAGLARTDRKLLEAARLAGASPLRSFFEIMLPLIRPSIVYATAVALLLGLGQFTAPLLLGTNNDVRVLTTEVYRFASSPPVNFAGAAAVASPLLAVGLAMVVFQRFLLKDGNRFVMDVNKGSSGSGSPSQAAPWILAIYGIVTLAMPLTALVLVSFSPFWTGDIQLSQFTLDNFRKLFDDPTTVGAILTSLRVSLVAVIVAIPVGYVFADVVHRRTGPRWVRIFLDAIVGLPLGIPAVVFGAGFLFTYISPPLVLYGTDAVLVVAYVSLMLPYTTRLQLAGRMSLGTSYEAAARVSGAGPWRVHLNIVAPMMRASIGGAAALMFVLMSHEFAASLMVRSAQTQVMGTRFYDLWVNQPYPMVGAMGLVMCAITALGVLAAFRVGGSGALHNL